MHPQPSEAIGASPTLRGLDSSPNLSSDLAVIEVSQQRIEQLQEHLICLQQRKQDIMPEEERKVPVGVGWSFGSG